MRFKSLLGVLGAVCIFAFTALPVLAQQYPSRPIKIIVGFGAGGSTDAIARFYAQRLSLLLKTSVFVENKAGAAQMVAIKAIMAAPPDGYTMYLGSGSSLSQAPGVTKDLPYDPLKDFTLIALVATVPGVIIVANDLPAHSMRELVDYSLANPTKLNYGSSGIGSASHLQEEYLKTLTGLKAAHIPLKSDADIVRELMVGSVHMGFSPLQGAISAIGAKNVRALAVTGSKRLKRLPDVPSLSEAGFKGIEGIDPYTYYGLVGPPGTPANVVAKLNEAINAVANMPDAVKQLQDTSFAEPGTGSPEAFRNYMRTDIEKWRGFSKLVKLSE